MKNRVLSSTPLMLALALALASTPAMAQGRGNGNGNGKAKSEQTRKAAEERRPVLQRRADDQDDDRYDDRYGTYGTYGTTAAQQANVKRGWCTGRGNPHNTVANCGYSAARTNGTYSASRSASGSSYYQQHLEFHRYLDQKYSALAAQNPLDIRRQIALRSQKSAEHQQWHAQTGTRHEDF